MPGRDLKGDYRYAYQGQEKDTETGKEAFELRLWDSRIGRWLTTDPYGQFASPYLGMHNNPIRAIDPDGGFTQWIDRDGNVVHDDGIDNGTVYFVNEGYEFNGNIDQLTANSTLLTKDFKVVADTDLIQEYVTSQFFKGYDGLDKSFFSGGITTFDTRSNSQGFAVGRMLVRRNTENGITLGGQRSGELNPTLTIRYNSTLENNMLSNVYNLRNTLEHESDHYWTNLGIILTNDRVFYETIRAGEVHTENAAMDFQQSTPTWNLTTQRFRQDVQWYRDQHKN